MNFFINIVNDPNHFC